VDYSAGSGYIDLDTQRRALQSDPFLSRIGRLGGLVVRPDCLKPPDEYKQDIRLEDELLRTHGGAIVLGAYLGECVEATALNLSERNPGYFVAVDPMHSIDRRVATIPEEYRGLPTASIA